MKNQFSKTVLRTVCKPTLLVLAILCLSSLSAFSQDMDEYFDSGIIYDNWDDPVTIGGLTLAKKWTVAEHIGTLWKIVSFDEMNGDAAYFTIRHSYIAREGYYLGELVETGHSISNAGSSVTVYISCEQRISIPGFPTLSRGYYNFHTYSVGI